MVVTVGLWCREEGRGEERRGGEEERRGERRGEEGRRERGDERGEKINGIGWIRLSWGSRGR